RTGRKRRFRRSNPALALRASGPQRGPALVGSYPNFDCSNPIDEMVESDMTCKTVESRRVRFKGYDLAIGSRPVSELERIDPDVGTHIEAYHAWSHPLSQKSRYPWFMRWIHEVPVLGVD